MRPGQWEAHVEFTPDGTLLSSAQQGETLLWNARTGRIARRFAIGGEPAISADGKSLALAVNSPSPALPSSSIAVLDMHTGARRGFPAALPSTWVTSLAYTPDQQRIVGASFDGDVHVWDVPTGSIAETYSGLPGGRAEAVLDPAGRTVFAGSDDGSVLVSDLFGARRLGRSFRWNTPDHSCGGVPCVVVNPQSTVMATDQGDGSIALIDLRTLRHTATLPARNGPTANALAFFADGRTLLSGGISGRLTLWNVRSHSVLRTIATGEPVWWAAPSPDGRLLAVQTQAAGSAGSHVRVLSAATGAPLWTHELADGIGGLYFSPDGSLLAALGCCTARSSVAMWNAHSGAALADRRSDTHATAIAYSPNSHTLGVGVGVGVGTEDGRVLFLDPHTGHDQAPPLRAASGAVDQISFAPNRTTFSVGSFDLSTTLWDLHTRNQLGNSFPEQLGAIPAPTFERSGRLLIDYLSNAAEWPLDVPSLERFACQVAGRDLTPTEWRDILPDRPYTRVCA